jgi:hypothetical protein
VVTKNALLSKQGLSDRALTKSHNMQTTSLPSSNYNRDMKRKQHACRAFFILLALGPPRAESSGPCQVGILQQSERTLYYLAKEKSHLQYRGILKQRCSCFNNQFKILWIHERRPICNKVTQCSTRNDGDALGLEDEFGDAWWVSSVLSYLY